MQFNPKREFKFGVPTGTLAECIKKAESFSTHPVVLADSGDNPTAGGTDDRADVLAALLQRHIRDVVIAGICDPPATEACYRAGVGATLPLNPVSTKHSSWNVASEYGLLILKYRL